MTKNDDPRSIEPGNRFRQLASQVIKTYGIDGYADKRLCVRIRNEKSDWYESCEGGSDRMGIVRWIVSHLELQEWERKRAGIS
jgi:hypothetical protein